MDVLTLILMFWLAIGSLTAHLAKQKGRNPLIWGIAGFLGGVVTCFIIFILPKAPKNDPLLTPEAGLLWYYLDHENRQHGPMSYQTLLRHKKDISYVWNETMKDWAPA